MTKSKSINFPFLVLVLLFVLSQTTFALTANLSAKRTEMSVRSEMSVEQNETLTAYTVSRDYDIDILGNKIPIAANTFSMADTAQLAVLSTVKEEETPAAPIQEIKSVVKYVNADELNVREASNSGSKLVTTLKRGDKVTYYETTGEWAKITTWSDKKGYILAKHLVNSEKEVEKVAETVSVKKTATVSRSTSEKTTASQPASTEALSLAEKIVHYAKSLQGVKYVYGGYSKSGFDCSGFTKYVFAKYDISVPRSSSEYWGFGTKVARSDIRAGDIVIFDTDGGTADVSHVGIYVGGGNFIHASTTKGKVIVMNLSSYKGKYMGARRVIK